MADLNFRYNFSPKKHKAPSKEHLKRWNQLCAEEKEIYNFNFEQYCKDMDGK